jgi:mono/diheme cytochrome c family protein
MRLIISAAVVLALFDAYPSNAGAFDLDKECSSCHALAKPAKESFEQMLSRKAPDLWYAGDKFREDWLVAWLQDPKAIRPAGYPYFRTIKEGVEKDEVDPSKLIAHPKLAAAEASAAATSLMALKGPPDLVPAGAFKESMSGAKMGALSFAKLRGCVACHQAENDKGGSSGPEMRDAGARLRPDFIAAYMVNPQSFDPFVWMPAAKLSDVDVQRLTAYLVSLGAGDQK